MSMIENKSDPKVIVPTIAVSSAPKKRKMKRWPDNNALVPYADLIKPVKEIIDQGYRFIRNHKTEFDYSGYNIGKREAEANPNLIPKRRFEERGIAIEKFKYDRNLIDIALNVAFLLGMEQGRRTEKRNTLPNETLISNIEQFRNSNKELRFRIDELEAYIEAKNANPDASNETLAALVIDIVKARRASRISAIKEDLLQDNTKSSFATKSVSKAKFSELEMLAKSEKCSIFQWKEVLETRGWTLEEWNERCKKKSVNIEFKDPV